MRRMFGLILTVVQHEAATVGEDDIWPSDDEVNCPPPTKLQAPVLGLGLLHKILTRPSPPTIVLLRGRNVAGYESLCPKLSCTLLDVRTREHTWLVHVYISQY